jgi:pSer/pThr/pTyr-binding forkhead associated (FHA) protein
MAHVQVLTGLKLGPRIDITSDLFAVGRAADNSLVLTDPSISFKHCVIEKNVHGQYVLKDLNSTNGTRVNETLIQEHPHPLTAKDILKFGSIEALFDGDDVAPAEKSRIAISRVNRHDSTARSPFLTKTNTGTSNRDWLTAIAIGTVLLASFVYFFIRIL